VTANAPEWDPQQQTAAAQAQQFGYNNDYIGFLSLPLGSSNSSHGLLVVNLEYTDPQLMFANTEFGQALTAEQTAVEMAAHGIAVIEIERREAGWRVIAGSRYARRISASTAIRISGPAAGDPRLATAADPSGRWVMGTINNCGGGVTPWGTSLHAEENFNHYFRGEPDQGASAREARSRRRYGIGGSNVEYHWGVHHARFDLAQEPNEPNRFGWVVELDPFDPEAIPVKRTALGRMKHEGSTVVVNGDGRVVVYMGDDQKFDYVYRFCSAGRFIAGDRDRNRELLDQGTLAVARFQEDGTLDWLPLVWGEGPLNASNGFASQADVLIDTRLAADWLGATPLDRPEDVEPSPTTGFVYVMLTNNSSRQPNQVDAANPRARNLFGHILELRPPASATGVDHTAPRYQWEVLLRCGDPASATDQALYHPDVSRNGWLAAPDNAAFDNKGRLWISTDRGAGMQQRTGAPDGIYATDVQGAGRALTRMFFGCPRGAEMCGPCFTPDGTTLFVAVQHPGEEQDSSFDRPSTRWPDFIEGVPPRPTVMAITRDDGGPIGG
jgi:secreted PhoX family phosphatase